MSFSASDSIFDDLQKYVEVEEEDVEVEQAPSSSQLEKGKEEKVEIDKFFFEEMEKELEVLVRVMKWLTTDLECVLHIQEGALFCAPTSGLFQYS